ncbi:SHOCT domain-containing protein [Streptomyces sp. YIM 98790]|uniref:SHOCT domain-containing protein n=1 Tax=Streptomyces sp. YIM 98790 TaxID=2689077 RepID=UPI00140E8403
MYWDGGGWMWMMAIAPLVWIALIGLVVWAVIRLSQNTSRTGGEAGSRDHGMPGRESAEEILDRRFARGEIDAEEYTQARGHLARHRPEP